MKIAPGYREQRFARAVPGSRYLPFGPSSSCPATPSIVNGLAGLNTAGGTLRLNGCADGLFDLDRHNPKQDHCGGCRSRCRSRSGGFLDVAPAPRLSRARERHPRCTYRHRLRDFVLGVPRPQRAVRLQPRAVTLGQDPGDISTIEDAGSVQAAAGFKFVSKVALDNHGNIYVSIGSQILKLVVK
jgi:hypothetical protein